MKIRRVAVAILAVVTWCGSTSGSENLAKEQLFYDDFENGLTNWSTTSVAGDDVWHFSGDDGIDGSKCARFYVTSNPPQANDDWLVSPIIKTNEINNLAITFKYSYNENGSAPDFYYTNSFDGNPANSEWILVEKNFWVDAPGWQEVRIEIENPGESFVFAVRYQVTENDTYYFLMDNFKITSFEPLVYTQVGSSNHFEYCTNMPDSSNFYLSIRDTLERQYAILTSLWDRPGVDNLFPDTSKIKVIYSQKDDLNIDEDKDYSWKLGFHDREKLEIYLCPINTDIQRSYYKNLSGLAKNEFSQLTVSRQFMRENMNLFPDYFLEGFGLYECEDRPRRDSLLNLINHLGTNIPPMSVYGDLSDMPTTSLKDLLLFCVEAKILVGCYYEIEPYGYEYGWSTYLKHYYQNDSPERIKLQHTTPQFNIYSSDNEKPHLEQIGNEFELKLDSLEDQYQMEIPHKWNICIYTEPVGMEIMGYNDYFNGGSAFWGDKIALITPIGADMDVYLYSLMHHEFMHTFFSHFCYKAPGGFFNEGIADFANGPLAEAAIDGNKWKINGMFDWYQDNLQRDPTFQEIVENYSSQGENGYDPDIYFLGHLFYTYIFENYASYVQIREFWNRGQDYSVFGGKTEEEIGLEYIQYLKELANIDTDQKNASLPFLDDFSNDYENWTTVSVAGDDQWHISGDDGIDGSKCARFYVISNPRQANDDWLVSPVFNNPENKDINITFKYLYHTDGIIPEFYYSSNFDGNPDNSTWTNIDNSFWQNMWSWNDASINIMDPGETFVFAIRYQNTTESSNYILIDNLQIISEDIPEYVLVGNSEHFNFYTNMPDSADFYLNFKDALEEEFITLNSHWNRPGQDKVYEDSYTVNVYYTKKEDEQALKAHVDSWRCGFYMTDGSAIYLTPLITNEQKSYYYNLEGEAVHTFSKSALRKRMMRDHDGSAYLPGYYAEGFGLYEIGYRPNRDSIISYLSEHPGELDHTSISDYSDITSTSKKDIIVSYVEGQILLPLGYRGCEPDYGSYPPIWNNYLKYFYNINDEEQMKKYASSENFDIYCSSRDTMYIDSILVWLDRTQKFYRDSFDMEFNNRFHMCILYDEKTGMDLTGYDNFNGGSGGLNISPHNFYDGIEGYEWLLAHEFGHVYNDYMYYDFPFGFFHEGMANFSGYKQCGDDWSSSRPLIGTVFNFYLNKYRREPKLEEFINNPDADDPRFNGIDPYFFGLEFIRYLTFKNSLLDIKAFFNNGLDYSYLNESYEEIEFGYKTYLKNMVHLQTGTEELKDNPFNVKIDENNITIQNTKSKKQHITAQIFNLSGQLIFNKSMELLRGEYFKISLPLEQKNQILLFKLNNGDETFTQKILN